MKSEALVRQKMDTVSVRVEKTVVAPVNQIPGLLEAEVGAAWLEASLPAVAHLRFIGHEPASSHVSLFCFIFPVCWLLFFTNPTERRPVSHFFLPFLCEIIRADAEPECMAERSGTGPQLVSGIEGFSYLT